MFYPIRDLDASVASFTGHSTSWLWKECNKCKGLKSFSRDIIIKIFYLITADSFLFWYDKSVVS